MVEDKSSLLNLLRVQRSDEDAVVARRFPWRWTALVALLAAAVAGYRWAAPVPVTVAIAQEAAVVQTKARPSVLDASGYIVARRQATVSAQVIGRVSQVLIEEGQAVEQGEVIARLDDSAARVRLAEAEAQVGRADAAVRAAQSAYEVQRGIHDRQVDLFHKKMISAQEFDTGKATYLASETGLEVERQSANVARAQHRVAQQNLEDTVIRAPFAGVVTVKAAQTGEIVSPSSAGGFTRTGIGTIVDMSSLELEVEISESFIDRIHPGQEANVVLNAYPDWTIPGELIAVVPTADRAKATVKVRVALKVSDPRIIPEMGARVAFLDAVTPEEVDRLGDGAVAIPVEGVQPDGADDQRGFVFVVVGDRVQRRAVRLGGENQLGRIVLLGLKPRDQVVIGDLNALTDQSRVRVQR